MKKRILSILLLCCMVLTLLPTTAFAADELPDVKLSVPTTFDKTVYLTNQKKELKITDSKTYLIKGSADPNWYFQYRIKIDGGRKKITPHIFLDGVRLQAPKDGPAIELYGGASACLYFIGNDSELIGAENFAALQKNKTDGHLRVLVQTGTKLTCEGGRYGAGIGGSKVGIKNFSQGHSMNLHFGSLATDIYGGEILATSGVYGAGIGGGQGGVGEQIYVYSGKLTVRSVSEGAGIGGGQGGPGRFIYIKGGTVNAGSESGGAGIGSGDQDGQNKSEDAHHIEISGGTVEAWSNYAGAGIGGGRGGSGYDISITGGVVRAQGYYGAGIGGGMNGDSGNILIKDTTLTALALPLYSSPDYTALSASAVGRGSNRVHYQVVMQDQEFAMSIEENIKIGASNGKSVWLSATGWQWRHNQEPKKYWYWDTTTELLIPNENGRVDLQRLSLPYAYNYGRVISKLELRCEESTCSHEFGWAIRDDCHIWACMKCGARDPAAEMSKQNGKHIPGDWSNQKQLCTVCDHVLERDTKAPVMETLTDGESYTVEDTLDGKPGAYTFTVIDPAASGETSSGVKSVTINGVEQDGPTYRLPAPDGGNNDAGAEYTVVATDNAGNETTATGAGTARATGTNARMLIARIGTKASRTRPRTSTPMTRIRPAMFAATSAPSRRPPTSTATATGARTARATGTNARMLTARIGTRASRTRPRTSTPMTRIRPATPAATSARSRRPPMSTATAIGARTARATGTNARMLTARIEKKASRTKPLTSTPMTRIRPATLAVTSAPSRRPPMNTSSPLTATAVRPLSAA